MHSISFIIPCYRSQNTIGKVIDEIADVMSQRTGYGYEIVCVNDCSPDNVANVLIDIAKANKSVKVINLAKNMGKHAAVLAGYSFAKGDIIVNLDDDCQSPVSNLWELIDPIENENYDCTMAKYNKKNQAAWKNVGSTINSMVGSFMLERPDGFRFDNFWAIKRFVAEEMMKYPNAYPYLEGLLLRVTQSIKQIPMDERSRGDSNATGYTLKKSIALFINGFTAFSVKPLRLSTVVGVLAAIIGFIWAIIILIKKLIGGITVLGYTSSMIIQLIIGGLILMSLGLLGEYIGRIYISINKSPQYVIRNTYNIDE